MSEGGGRRDYLNMHALLRDLHLAARSLRRAPLLTAVGVASIAVAVMASTLVFSWLQNLVLDPYPAVKDPSRIVALNAVAPDGNVSGAPPLAYPTFRDWAREVRSLEGIAAYAPARLSMRIEGVEHADAVWALVVSGNYFEVLGVRPARGRVLVSDDERAVAPVAVLSHDCWMRRFGGDPTIVGRGLTLNGHGVTVVGVASPGFGGTVVGVAFDLWIPLTLQPYLGAGASVLEDRSARWLQAFGRLAPGTSLAQARRDVETVAQRVSTEHGERPVSGGTARRMREQFLGSLLFPLFSAMLGVTGLVLLIACANVAGLLLARGVVRAREIAIQMAVGASRGAIARRLAVESGLLAAAGGTVGAFLAIFGRAVFGIFTPPSPLPVNLQFRTDPATLWFAAGVTGLAALAFGLVPVWRASRTSPVHALKDGARGSVGSPGRIRTALVVGQVTFTVVALALGGLFLRSLVAVGGIDLGFADPSRVLLVGTDTRLAALDAVTGAQALDKLLEETRHIPGVVYASLSTMVPLGFGGHKRVATAVEGYQPASTENTWTERVRVAEGYFETMGIPIVRGRALDAGDRTGSVWVAVVNEALAERYWPGENPVGRRLDQGEGWVTVVGVARNSLYGDLGETPYAVVYTAIRQFFTPAPTLLVRASGPPAQIAVPLQRAFRAAHPDLPMLDVRTLRAHMGASTFVQRLGGAVLTAFGILALALAAIGLYGVASYLVGQRTRELGVRVALGARPSDVLGLVVRHAGRLAAVGIGLGTVAAVAIGRFVAGQLVGISPADPTTLGAVAVLVTAVALAAAGGPARRASRSDPVAALRAD